MSLKHTRLLRSVTRLKRLSRKVAKRYGVQTTSGHLFAKGALKRLAWVTSL